MLFIVVLFHLSPFKHFKAFYHYGIGQHRAWRCSLMAGSKVKPSVEAPL
jgi:hypothetical protein